MSEDEIEEWRDIVGYEGIYQVSDLGNVRNSKSARATSDNGHGYLQVSFSNNSKRHTFKVHRLVAIVFVPNPENKPQVNHKNGNKKDNRAINLEWCNNSENVLHAYAIGLRPILSINQGEYQGRSKLKTPQVIEIKKLLLEGRNNSSIAREFGVTREAIREISKGRNWKHINI